MSDQEKAGEVVKKFSHWDGGIEWVTNPSPDELREAIAEALAFARQEGQSEVTRLRGELEAAKAERDEAKLALDCGSPTHIGAFNGCASCAIVEVSRYADDLKAKLALEVERCNILVELSGKKDERVADLLEQNDRMREALEEIEKCDTWGTKLGTFSLVAYRARAALLPAPPQKSEEKCIWAEDSDGNWDTSCGETYTFLSDGPKENKTRFCCFCGKNVEPVKYSETEGESPAQEEPNGL